MRILHTSDWHLGASLEGVSRQPEHAAFLAWLRGILDEREVDVLLVSGDIFDGPQPAAEAQRLYYDFLADVASSRVRRTIVVGGNHDSPSRLEAPSEVLRSLSVHVVGGYDSRQPGDLIFPIPGDDGRVAAVVLAVPFVHEMRLGISTTAADQATVQQQFRTRFAGLYRMLADLAERDFGPVPLVATGHLTAGSADRRDYPYEIHQVGSLGSLPASIFDPRLCYVALGHIHRRYRVEQSRAYYSGSPLPILLAEANRPHGVLLFELGDAEPEFIRAPLTRALVHLSGNESELVAALGRLSWSEPCPPLVFLELSVEGYDPGALERLEQGLGTEAARVVSLRQRTPDARAPSCLPAETLGELEPEAVFRLLCERKGAGLDADLLAAFRDVLDEARGGAEARGS
jgi:exonuclease SbcD